MKRGVELYTSAHAHHRPGVYDALIAIVPGASSPYHWFRTTLHDDDPRLSQIYQLFEKFSIQRMDMKQPGYRELERSPNGYFTERYLHLFDQSEIDAAAYMYMHASDFSYNISTHTSDPGAPQRVYLDHGGKANKLLCSFFGFFIKEKFKPVLDAEHFVGLQLATTIAIRENLIPVPKQWPVDKAIFYLDSTVALPPMPQNEITTTPESPRHWLANPGFDDRQPVYRRNEFSSHTPFDYARTWECVLPHQPHRGFAIVSQRFRQFCLKHKMRFDFVPVKYVD
ncbi:hypothetical protein LBMAG48_18130 [Phycisphaerae bacterium]|nr:hypothetical protein LBMAG48_18130 [Phycisphaerae bacterium]